MKKIVSLLLVFVLSLGMLSGICFAADMPTECTEAEAGVKVTVEGDSTAYYFPELTQEVISWTTENLLTGMRTITLLKDVTLNPDNAKSSGNFFELGSTQASWGSKNQGKLTFDLNGHTISYTGVANLIYSLRWGCTVKNGTINYTCTNATTDHFLFATGSWKGGVTAAAVYDPVFILDNMTVNDYSATKNHAMMRTFNYEAHYQILNSTVYVQNGDVMMFFKGTQEEATKIYEGDFNSKLTIQNSTIVTEGSSLIRTDKTTPDTATVNISDSLFVVNGELKSSICNATIKAEGEENKIENHTVTLPSGKTVTGTAYAYGNAPGLEAPKLPFTDVAEGDWYYSFVAEMYHKGVINGMTETTFVPNGTLTYGQALKLVAVGLGRGEQPAGSHWASGYLTLAKNEGWLSGDVDLNGSVSRLAFCQIAAKAASLVEQPASNPFKDTADTSVLALVNAGVINGMSEDTFSPNGLLTRAQIAKIISLLVKL